MKNKKGSIAFIITLILLLGIILLFLFATLTDSKGTLLAHKYTNVMCNFYYDEDIKIWKFEINSSNNQDFISECQKRGIGDKN